MVTVIYKIELDLQLLPVNVMTLAGYSKEETCAIDLCVELIPGDPCSSSIGDFCCEMTSAAT